MSTVTFDEKDFNEGFNLMFDGMVEKQGDELAKNKDSIEDKKSIEDTLRKCSDFLASREFSKMVNFQAKECGVNKKYIKNVYAANMLDKVGTNLGLSIEIVGNAMKLLVNFIGYLLKNIFNIAVGVLVKIVHILTFKTVPVI